MNIAKVLKDKIVKTVAPDYAPLNDLHQYLRDHGSIHFHHEHLEDGTWISRSTNFSYGRILTTGKDLTELDRNIKDAILTAFDVPSSYAKEAHIHAEGKNSEKYALA